MLARDVRIGVCVQPFSLLAYGPSVAAAASKLDRVSVYVCMASGHASDHAYVSSGHAYDMHMTACSAFVRRLDLFTVQVSCSTSHHDHGQTGLEAVTK